ncbi:Ser/Thr protein kinase RdoA (MazF antagonist) [Achromobacter deleyi]|uniref:phosphotransferase n=1 Tax=Achromobacter deleyi TaxID=1353891 RepID=UPI0028553E4A|nr:phosphotransferase [Achromobacter deleyi]MDR6600525.1 Ser/Thr protein kinase RdoA (MazF antagonist) [Achromobacter deleyi]
MTDQDCAEDVLATASPDIDESQAAQLARQHFGVEAEVRRLTGERDRNFHLRAGAGREYVLKFSHPAEDPRVADFQARALQHVERVDPGLPVQRVMPAADGAPSVWYQAPDAPLRVLRLFTYLPGRPLPDAPRSDAQRRNLAQVLARLGLALRGFEHPAGALNLPWDIQRTDEVAPLLTHIADPARRALAQRALARFTDHAKPALCGLRAQAIHNDLNLYNVLVDPHDPDTIAGILDFGDMVRAPLINDVAVAASYQLEPGAELLEPAVRFVAAYHEVNPLARAEVDILFDLMMARLVMVVAIGGWRAARYPENRDYILRNNAVSWSRLQACDGMAREHAQQRLRAACGFH